MEAWREAAGVVARPVGHAFFLLACGIAALACTGDGAPPPPPTHRGPIILITFEGIRADEVGGLAGRPGATPNLDRLIAEADWAGRAVASSSWAAPAMASVLTGLTPWQHQVLHPERARLHAELYTLPEALSELGYRTTAYSDGPWLAGGGYRQGFDTFHPLRLGKRATGHLASLRDRRDFLWIHLPEPQPPYLRRDWLPPAQDGHLAPPSELPRRLEALRLEHYYDPGIAMSEEEQRTFRSLYRYDLVWTDERLRRLLEAIRTSGHWDETLLVVTSSHGQEIGDHGQSLDGGHLGRELLEVPLVLKLPTGASRTLVAPDRRVAAARLWATLVEAAGGEPSPEAAPSLFDPIEVPILSEVYLDNGANRFSLLEGDLQLVRTARFAEPEARYFDARRARLGLPLGRPLTEAPEQIFARLTRLFTHSRPYSVSSETPTELALERWTGASGTVRVDDPAQAQEMSRRLSGHWTSFLDEELPPSEEARLWRDRPIRRPAGR